MSHDRYRKEKRGRYRYREDKRDRMAARQNDAAWQKHRKMRRFRLPDGRPLFGYDPRKNALDWTRSGAIVFRERQIVACFLRQFFKADIPIAPLHVETAILLIAALLTDNEDHALWNAEELAEIARLSRRTVLSHKRKWASHPALRNILPKPRQAMKGLMQWDPRNRSLNSPEKDKIEEGIMTEWEYNPAAIVDDTDVVTAAHAVAEAFRERAKKDREKFVAILCGAWGVRP